MVKSCHNVYYLNDMKNLKFDLIRFDRCGREVVDHSITTECEGQSVPNLMDVCDVLQFLYPRANGVRVTIM